MPPTGTGTDPAKKTSDVTSIGTKEFLIAAKRGRQARNNGQIQPLSAHQFQATLTSIPFIKVKQVIPRHGATAPMSMFAGEATDVVVADIDEAVAPALQAQANSAGVIIEENAPLEYVGMSPLRAAPYQPPIPLGAIAARKITIRVTGAGDAPQPDASVMLQGDGFMQNAKTNAKGEVTLDLWTIGDGPARYVWVKPRANHWDRYIATPDLVEGATNVIRLQAFAETIPGFPNNFVHGWGQKLMGLPSRPDFAKGRGVKIAIIDSGADTAHPLLNHIKLGLDASGGGQPDGWKVDTIGHGSHVAGVITANGGTGNQLTGFAPEAEVHVIKVFPGGYDALIQALNYCVAQKIDVVNMSLGGTEISVAVEQALQEATVAGVACIVAAGNSGDAVKYPASSPYSLAVAAVGSSVDTRSQSWGQTQVIPESVAADGVYAAKFSCHGPEIAVCAPGVAIVSTLPGNSFGTDDGTSMASPHVTGLAALLLAHHPLFRTTFAGRNQGRVAALFEMLRALCTTYPFADGRAGSGLPVFTPAAGAQFVPGADGAQPSQPMAPSGVGGAPMAGAGVLHALSAMPGGGQQPSGQLGGLASADPGWPQAGLVSSLGGWRNQPPFGGLFWMPSTPGMPPPFVNGAGGGFAPQFFRG